jgi:hypothetical protein
MARDEPTDVQRYRRDRLLERIHTISGSTSDETIIDVGMDITRALGADQITAGQARGLRTIYHRTMKAAIYARSIREPKPPED